MTLAPPDEQADRLSRQRFLGLGTVASLGVLLVLTSCGNGGDEDND